MDPLLRFHCDNPYEPTSRMAYERGYNEKHKDPTSHMAFQFVTNRPIKSVISFFYIITTCIRSLHLIHITKTQEMFRTMNLHINVFPSCLQDHNTPSGHLASHHTHLLHGIAYLGSYSSNYSLQEPRNCPRTYY